jgi:ribonuclease BN (tRNA processing enzyme)
VALSVTVLGASGTYAGPSGACSGYLVDDGATRVWVDCGPGTLANLQCHAALTDVDAIVVSHVHPDHWLELPVVRNALKYGFGREGLPVFGTGETLARIEALLDDAIAPTFSWQTISDGARFDVGGLSFAASRTDHPVETLALRVVADGSSLAYSADTGPAWSVEAFDEPVDLALVEATLLADQEGQAPHLSARQAGAMARAAGVGRLVITHVWPMSEPDAHRAEAAEAFGADVEVAHIHGRYTA